MDADARASRAGRGDGDEGDGCSRHHLGERTARAGSAWPRRARDRAPQPRPTLTRRESPSPWPSSSSRRRSAMADAADQSNPRFSARKPAAPGTRARRHDTRSTLLSTRPSLERTAEGRPRTRPDRLSSSRCPLGVEREREREPGRAATARLVVAPRVAYPVPPRFASARGGRVSPLASLPDTAEIAADPRGHARSWSRRTATRRSATRCATAWRRTASSASASEAP